MIFHSPDHKCLHSVFARNPTKIRPKTSLKFRINQGPTLFSRKDTVHQAANERVHNRNAKTAKKYPITYGMKSNSLSSLAGLFFYSPEPRPINRWAIFFRPPGCVRNDGFARISSRAARNGLPPASFIESS